MSQAKPRGAPRGSGKGSDLEPAQEAAAPLSIRVTEGRGEDKELIKSSIPAFIIDLAVYDEKTGKRLPRGCVRIKSNTLLDLYTEAKVVIAKDSLASVIEVYDLTTLYIELHDVCADVEFMNTMTLEFVKRRLAFV